MKRSGWKDRALRFLFPATEAEFSSLYSLPESIARLRAATDQAGLFSQTMSGKFQGTSVVLSRDIPFVGNHYVPVFSGAFQLEGERVVLRGQFRTKDWFIVYQCCGLGFVALLGVPSLLVAAVRPQVAWWVPCGFLGLLVLLAGQIRLWQWFGRNDPAWLSRRIGRALGRPADWPDPTPGPPGRWRRWWREAAGQ